MAQENKYDGESDDENEDEDYFSTDSGIGALKFRKRLEQLQAQSKRLENLQFQLKTIKNENYINRLDTICGVSIIQPQTKNNKNKNKKQKKRKASDHKVVLKLFIENETERAFAAGRNNDFASESYSFWKDTFEANNLGMCQTIQLVETTYTLFRKTLNSKDFIFLIVGDHSSQSENNILSYRLVDILQSMIVDLCSSLQIKTKKSKNNKNNSHEKLQRERKMSLTAMVEILDEVFGGNGSDVYPLNKTEFVTCMRVRIGMESVWKDDTKKRLEELFEEIVNSCLNDGEDIDIIQSNTGKYKCLRFDNFISYFSPGNNSNFETESNSSNGRNDSDRANNWKDIKRAVKESPLSRRNKELREKENISAVKYREKLNNIEKLINLLEEAVIYNESNENENENNKMVKNEQLFWRKKILQHREFVRFYQDVILNETIEENKKMKLKIDKLVKLNKFSKKVQFEENEWFKKNKHLIQIESQYYTVLKKQRNQQIQMKKCEKEIHEKDNQIIELKTKLNQLIDIKKKESQKINKKNRNRNGNGHSNGLNDKILKLKQQIAQKKFEVQNELEVMNANLNNNNNNNMLYKKEKIKQDRV